MDYKKIPPVFIGGAGRSGTTLVRVILDSHSCVSCGPELKITVKIAEMMEMFRKVYKPFLLNYNVSPVDSAAYFRNLLNNIFSRSLESSGKKRIAEKTPGNSFVFHLLNAMFPDSPLIHVIRDGRDVVASLLKMDWRDPSGNPVAYTQDAEKASLYWRKMVSYTREQASRNNYYNGKYKEIKYEDIISSPEKTLKSLFSFIDEDWEEGVLDFYKKERDLAGESSAAQVSQGIYRTSRGRWRSELTQSQRSAVACVAGDLLIELGYAEDKSWING